ncbi:MAG TPA: hypothetical protein VGM39_07065 [Kofleriaceae bacterium]
MRGEKRTKEIDQDELERLKKPEERPTSAIDPVALQALVNAASPPRAPTDDLAIPVEPPNLPKGTPADVSLAARAAADAVARAHTPSWSGPTKETAVIVNERPTDDPAPTRRSREGVERISHASLGMVTVEPPRGIAPLPKPRALSDNVPEPVRFPRASTRQPTLDETMPVRKGSSPIAMFLALAIPGILLAIGYVLIR